MFHYYNFNTKGESFYWTAEKIQELIKQKVDLSEIAVIGRNHKSLKEFWPYLKKMGIPVHYKKGENVLENPIINELINFWKFLVFPRSEENLIEILSYPFWGLSNLEIWKLLLAARNQKIQLDSKTNLHETRIWAITKESENLEIQKIGVFLEDLINRAKDSSFEEILDYTLGNVNLNDFTSNFKKYYFPKFEILKTDLADDLQTNNQEKIKYLNFLSNLSILISKIREYTKRQFLTLKDVVEYLELMKAHNQVIIDSSPFIQGLETVKLLTAHSAKGLEYEYVFVLNCNQSEWAKNAKSNKISLPSNLPFAPIKDDFNDYLRLFFVAITRAKKELFLLNFNFDENNKEMTPLQFLTDLKPTEISFEDTPQKIIQNLEIIISPDKLSLDLEEQRFLHSLLEDYSLPVTHLQKFLDIKNGGPRAFLEDNLLRYPKAKTESMSLGTAMHSCMEKFYRFYKEKQVLMTLEEVLFNLEIYINNQGLDKLISKHLFEKAKKSMTVFYEQKCQVVASKFYSEYDFKSENVFLDEVKIAGKIDYLEIFENEIIVVDFKTGKAIINWKSSNDDEKIKLWKYRQQLEYYKILIEKSRTFGRKYQVNLGKIIFLEPKNEKIIELESQLSDTFVLENLIKKVHTMIINLDFPDTSDYEPNFNGIQKFVQTILEK
jgi:DNA helicase-2/ATP-dependent DNA helicase PcrA